MKKVTIASVAKKVGVSIATVSYALSGKRKISPEVANKIKEAINELGYKPSVIARNLASNKNWTVGFYTSSTKNIKGDFFFNSLLAGILDNLHEKKYQLHLYADYLNGSTNDHPDLSMTQPIDGALIMNPRLNDVYLDYLQNQGIPFVVVGTPEEPENVFYVDVDLTAAAYMATQYLISKGHQKILFINGPDDYMQSFHHMRGSRMAFDEMGLEIKEEDVINIALEENKAYSALESMGDDMGKYSAMLSFHDIFLYDVMSFFGEKGIIVPKDMAYVSLGNTQLSRLSSPTITSIDLAPYDIGYQSANMLVEIIEKKRIQPSHTVIPVKLIERNSV